MPSSEDRRVAYDSDDDENAKDNLGLFLESCANNWDTPEVYFIEEFGAALNVVLLVVYRFGKDAAIERIGVEQIIRDIFETTSAYGEDPRFGFGYWCNDCVPRVPPYDDDDHCQWNGKLDVRALEECLRSWFPENNYTISPSKHETINEELMEYEDGSISIAQCVLNRRMHKYVKHDLNGVLFPGVIHQDLLLPKYDEMFQSPLLILHEGVEKVGAPTEETEKNKVYEDNGADYTFDSDDSSCVVEKKAGTYKDEEFNYYENYFICNIQREDDGRLKCQPLSEWVNIEHASLGNEAKDMEETSYVKRVLRYWTIWDNPYIPTAYELTAITKHPSIPRAVEHKIVTISHLMTVPGKCSNCYV